MHPTVSSLAALFGALLLVASAGLARAQCVPPGAWMQPGPSGAKPVSGRELLGRAASQSIVLLGEIHDNAEHHRWQLHVIVALHALRPGMVIGFEMFPRRVQPALDRWVAGELSEERFLEESDWRNVWRLDPGLYMPIFHFARMHRVPMVALNVERSLTREVTERGLDAVPEAKREGVGRPAPASPGYLDWLFPIYAEHARPGRKDGPPERTDPDFLRFVESQQFWDRAMAEALASAASRPDRPLVVGVMGGGHLVRGFGVPHQLKALGAAGIVSLAPWDREADCKELVAGYADAVFGLAEVVDATQPRPRLGVYLDAANDGVRVRRVEPGSVAQAAGLRDDDIIVRIAGVAPRQPGDVSRVIERQAPGTWLPLAVKRGELTLDLVAKFPPEPR